MYGLIHSSLFLHWTLYFIAIVHCFVNSIKHCRKQRGKYICLFLLNTFLYYLIHSIVLMRSPSYFVTLVYCFFYLIEYFQYQKSKFFFVFFNTFFARFKSFDSFDVIAFIFTHIHCFVNSFEYCWEQQVRCFFCYDLIKVLHNLTHCIILIDSNSYFTTHIQCFVDSIEHSW